MKQKFTFYLHSMHDSSEFRHFLTEEAGLELSPDALENAVQSRPFYEVGIECEIDEKGNITMLGIKK